MNIVEIFAISRLIERAFISIIIVFMAIALMAIYRKRLQKIDVAVEKDGLTVRSSVTLALPIFLFLSIILYGWISLSNPVSLSNVATTPETGLPDGADGVLISGYGNNQDNDEDESLQDYARTLWTTRFQVRQLQIALTSAEPLDDVREIASEMVAHANVLEQRLDEILFNRFGRELPEKCMPSIDVPDDHSQEPECQPFYLFLLE